MKLRGLTDYCVITLYTIFSYIYFNWIIFITFKKSGLKSPSHFPNSIFLWNLLYSNLTFRLANSPFFYQSFTITILNLYMQTNLKLTFDFANLSNFTFLTYFRLHWIKNIKHDFSKRTKLVITGNIKFIIDITLHLSILWSIPFII